MDELGYVKLDRHGAELLFQIFTEREERHAIAVASNRPFTTCRRSRNSPRLTSRNSPGRRPSAGGTGFVRRE
ncbi:ATP-binding protein, partial [Streptomyces sp. NPDC004752]